jgi:pyruvate decarboxylase
VQNDGNGEGGRKGRTILVVGDGSLQLTVQEIGTMVKMGLRNVIMYVTPSSILLHLLPGKSWGH